MPVELYGEDAPSLGTPVPWRFGGEDHVLLVRPVPQKRRDKIVRSVTARYKAKQFGEQTVAQQGDLGQEITRAVAAYALVDTATPFELITKSKDLAAAFGEAGVVVELDAPFKLKGLFTDAVKEVVFRLIPDMSAFISDTADRLAGIERNQEADLGKT